MDKEFSAPLQQKQRFLHHQLESFDDFASRVAEDGLSHIDEQDFGEMSDSDFLVLSQDKTLIKSLPVPLQAKVMRQSDSAQIVIQSDKLRETMQRDKAKREKTKRDKMKSDKMKKEKMRREKREKERLEIQRKEKESNASAHRYNEYVKKQPSTTRGQSKDQTVKKRRESARIQWNAIKFVIVDSKRDIVLEHIKFEDITKLRVHQKEGVHYLSIFATEGRHHQFAAGTKEHRQQITMKLIDEMVKYGLRPLEEDLAKVPKRIQNLWKEDKLDIEYSSTQMSSRRSSDVAVVKRTCESVRIQWDAIKFVIVDPTRGTVVENIDFEDITKMRVHHENGIHYLDSFATGGRHHQFAAGTKQEQQQITMKLIDQMAKYGVRPLQEDLAKVPERIRDLWIEDTLDIEYSSTQKSSLRSSQSGVAIMEKQVERNQRISKRSERVEILWNAVRFVTVDPTRGTEVDNIKFEDITKMRVYHEEGIHCLDVFATKGRHHQFPAGTKPEQLQITMKLTDQMAKYGIRPLQADPAKVPERVSDLWIEDTLDIEYSSTQIASRKCSMSVVKKHEENESLSGNAQDARNKDESTSSESLKTANLELELKAADSQGELYGVIQLIQAQKKQIEEQQISLEQQNQETQRLKTELAMAHDGYRALEQRMKSTEETTRRQSDAYRINSISQIEHLKLALEESSRAYQREKRKVDRMRKVLDGDSQSGGCTPRNDQNIPQRQISNSVSTVGEASLFDTDKANDDIPQNVEPKKQLTYNSMYDSMRNPSESQPVERDAPNAEPDAPPQHQESQKDDIHKSEPAAALTNDTVQSDISTKSSSESNTSSTPKSSIGSQSENSLELPESRSESRSETVLTATSPKENSVVIDESSDESDNDDDVEDVDTTLDTTDTTTEVLDTKRERVEALQKLLREKKGKIMHLIESLDSDGKLTDAKASRVNAMWNCAQQLLLVRQWENTEDKKDDSQDGVQRRQLMMERLQAELSRVHEEFLGLMANKDFETDLQNKVLQDLARRVTKKEIAVAQLKDLQHHWAKYADFNRHDENSELERRMSESETEICQTIDTNEVEIKSNPRNQWKEDSPTALDQVVMRTSSVLEQVVLKHVWTDKWTGALGNLAQFGTLSKPQDAALESE